jgi:hypothetical protein
LKELEPLEIVPLGLGAAAHFGRLKAELRAKGINKADLDMLIAATALDLGATLVTNDGCPSPGGHPASKKTRIGRERAGEVTLLALKEYGRVRDRGREALVGVVRTDASLGRRPQCRRTSASIRPRCVRGGGEAHRPRAVRRPRP